MECDAAESVNCISGWGLFFCCRAGTSWRHGWWTRWAATPPTNRICFQQGEVLLVPRRYIVEAFVVDEVGCDAANMVAMAGAWRNLAAARPDFALLDGLHLPEVSQRLVKHKGGAQGRNTSSAPPWDFVRCVRRKGKAFLCFAGCVTAFQARWAICSVSAPIEDLDIASPAVGGVNACAMCCCAQALKQSNSKAIRHGDTSDYCIAAASVIATVRPSHPANPMLRDGTVRS